MPDYRVNLNMENTRINPLQTGMGVGKAVGDIGSALAMARESDKASDQQIKVDQLIEQYNQGSGVFQGMQGSMKSKKLARLLLPYDQMLASKYNTKAEEEARQEEKQKVNLGVVGARQSVERLEGEPEFMTESRRLKAGAEEYMKTDPETAMGWLEKSRAMEEKSTEAKRIREEKEATLQLVDEAVRAWQSNPEDKTLQANLTQMSNLARSKGIAVKDVLGDYTRNKLAESTLGIQSQRLEDDRKREERRSAIESAKLGMDQAKLAADLRNIDSQIAEREKSKDNVKLGAEEKKAVASYETVLQTMEDLSGALKKAIDDPSVNNIRNVMYLNRLAVEFFGRPQSGAAISNSEWSSFRNIVGVGLMDALDKGQNYDDRINYIKTALNRAINTIKTSGGTVKQEKAPVYNLDKAEGSMGDLQ